MSNTESIGTIISDEETPSFETVRIKLKTGEDVKPGTQGYLVFGSDLGFRSQMLRFSRNIASTARSYSGKMFTHIK